MAIANTGFREITVQPSSMYGSMATGSGSKGMTPIIVVETLDDNGEIKQNSIQMQMQLDTGAELNPCGAN